MRVLIDGYNLLHTSGLIARGHGERALEMARDALLEFLARHLPESIAAATTVVFDAKNPPPGLPRVVVDRRITVAFAADHDEADDLLEELIRAESVPAKLWVISSDHRIQEAARRRRAQLVDSDVWYDLVLESQWPPRADRRRSGRPAKPRLPETDLDRQQWVEVFGGTTAQEPPPDITASRDTASRDTASRDTASQNTVSSDTGQESTDQEETGKESTGKESSADEPDDGEPPPFPAGFVDVVLPRLPKPRRQRRRG